MPALSCEIEGVSAVLVGNFNPSIFQPAWLAGHGLIRDAESKDAEIQIIRPELAIFKVGPFTLQADAERFKLETVDPGRAAALRDLITSIFQILSETPVRQFGINRNMHFRLESVEAWNHVGHRLAPKEIYEGLLEEPGTRGVTVWGKRIGSRAERVQVQIEPSLRVNPGVYVASNEHFEPDTSVSTSELLDILVSEWDASQRHARTVAEKILERALAHD